MKKIGIFTACILAFALSLFACPQAPVVPSVSLTLDTTICYDKIDEGVAWAASLFFC